MKPFYLLCLLLPLSSGLFAQSAPFALNVEELEAIPSFQETYLLEHGIKSVEIRTTKTLARGQQLPSQAVVREFNPTGQLAREVNLRPSSDTARVASYHYNANGLLGWKQITDMEWGKTYRTGYRFNSDKQVFLIRDYEMLANEQVMLLETRQYIYDEQDRLTAIRWKQGTTLTKVHRYSYHPDGAVAEERFENGLEEVQKIVRYEYYPDGNIQRILYTDANGQATSYLFTYDEKGLPTRVEWKQSEENQGSLAYQYSPDGLLVAVDKTYANRPAIHHDFAYEHFQ